MKSHDVSEFYENRLLCEIYVCTVVKTMLNELSMLNDYFEFFMCFFRKLINISVTLVSESYILLYYEQKVYMLSINKICLNQIYKRGKVSVM